MNARYIGLSKSVAASLFVLFQACQSGNVGRNSAPAPEPARTASFTLSYPAGLPADGAFIPPNNPMTLEKAKLGRRLFFEKSLSMDRSLSCASCHRPEKVFADPEQFSSGVDGKKGKRHAPTAINRVFSGAQFWDGRAASLEEQATGPVMNPVEMGMPDMKVAAARLAEDATYIAEFKSAFPPDGLINKETIGMAIAVFERTILCGNSPYDRFQAGQKNALSESAQRGLKIFKDENKGNCETCHAGPNFSDENYNNIGVGMTAKAPDLGRYEVTKLEGHQGAFKTPTLRNVAERGPYMHDGSQKTLDEVVDFYVKGGHPNRWLSPKMKPLNLTAQDRKDLVEFLKALSGEVSWYGKTGGE
jgi:cytochrome c peroxidase